MSSNEVLSDSQMAEIHDAARDLYGVGITRSLPLGGELDWNFRALTAERGPLFMRITPEPFDSVAIAWQDRVLLQLEERRPSVAVPVLLRTRDEATHAQIRLSDDRAVLLRLTSWVEGENVADFGATTRAFRNQLGVLAAEITECLEPLNHGDTEHASHHWMVENSGEALRSTMTAASDPHRRNLLETALLWFEGVQDAIPRLPRSVVHQDLHDFNLLAERNESGEAVVSGIVDFNDAVHTIRVAELAIAAAYAALRQSDPFLAFTEVVEGYLSRMPLTDLELDVLYPLAVARLAVNASTWTHRSTGQNATYAESRMAATWPALEALLRVSPSTAVDRFKKLALEHA